MVPALGGLYFGRIARALQQGGGFDGQCWLTGRFVLNKWRPRLSAVSRY